MSDPKHFVKDDNPSWESCLTLEDWLRKAIDEGREAEAVALLKTLPEGVKEKYRKLWKEMKAKK